jgi:hypothetical protein
MKTIIPFTALLFSINLIGCGDAGASSALFKDGVAGAAGDITLPGMAGNGPGLTTQDAPMCSAATTCVGQQGAAGPAGVAGPKGDVGPAGPAGADGADGKDGAQGPKGDPGVAGPMGPMGPAGPPGATSGIVGPQGPAGPAGATGAQGPEGPQGKPGATGPAGAPGAVGATGPQGPIGPQGPAGPAGKDGGGTTISRTTTYVVSATFTAATLTSWNARRVSVQCTNYDDIILSGGCSSQNAGLRLTGFGPSPEGTTLPSGSPLPNQAWTCQYELTGSAVAVTATAYCLTP